MTPARRESRLRVGQLFGLTRGALLLVAAIGLIAGMLALDSLSDSRRRVVDRTDPALVTAERFLVSMIDQETGVRGYMLTADDDFLEPYERNRERSRAELAALGRTVDTRAVEQAVDAWRTGFAIPAITAVRSGRTTFTADQLGEGKALFDAVRAAIADAEGRLASDRRTARAELTASASRVRLIVIGVAIAIILSVIATAIVLRRSIVGPISVLADQVRHGEHVHPGGAAEIAALGRDVEAMRVRITNENVALQEARDELQRSNTELEQFAYVASHDLQEPLRKIASFTQMLRSRYGGQLDERADTYIDFAVDGAKRMQDLINDLLAFSRVGRLTETPQVVDTDELVSLSRRALAETIEETRARIDTGPLPKVRGEPRLLELVFTNLIANGIKFHRPDVPPVVRISAERRDGEWCFTVADNGIGIDSEYADRIFIIFQRLHPRTAYDGTGIGLAMCRKIVDYHGGTIWLEQHDAPGATFHFTLPAIQEDEQ